MTRKRFNELWEPHLKQWLAMKMTVRGTVYSHSALCKVKDSQKNKTTEDIIYDTYELLKRNTKRYYFKPNHIEKNQEGQIDKQVDVRLSRYKRAAVLTYAIIVADPLCKLDNSPLNLDELYLKQRLAFYIALTSILQDFGESAHNLDLVFDFSKLGKTEQFEDEDDFCLSVYKDLFFAEYYDNYDVLAMANIYGLLTERCSNLTFSEG